MDIEPNQAWSNSSHLGSWSTLQQQLQTYLPKLPVDPINTKGPGGTGGWSQVFVYSYFSTIPNSYCPGRSAYMLVYSLEQLNPVDTIIPIEYCPNFFNYQSGPDNRWLITTGKVQ